ncbi:MAG: hypothetical protein U1E65_35185 [Myxococcota bacterium]
MKKFGGLLLLSVLSACSGPNLDEYEPHTGLIRGTVFYPAGIARGNVVVLLFRADDLPPPTGTGRPVNFVMVPSASLFGDVPAGAPRDFAAPFTIPTVAEGDYQIRAFLDADDDFNPLSDLLSQPTAGDVGGAYVDSSTRQYQTLHVDKDKATEHDILVILAQTMPLERPAFAITSSTGAVDLNPSYRVPFSAPAAMHLVAHPLNREQVRMSPERSGFLITYADDDGDGRPDDANGDHLPDLYPKVLLRQRGTPEGTTVVVPLIISPLPFVDALAAHGSSVTPSLDLIVPPVAVSITAAGRTILPSIPAGDYDTVVIESTGQTWQIPNDIDTAQPTATDPTQSVVVKMAAGQALEEGAIGGTIHVASQTPADAWVFAFRAENPPPPAGTGRPVAVASIPAAAFTRAGSGLDASFTVRNLAAGTYLLSALFDVDGGFSPLVDALAQPSGGDLGGSYATPVVIPAGGRADGLSLDINRPFLADRPAFDLVGGSPILIAAPVVQSFEIESRPYPSLFVRADHLALPVAPAGTDLDRDNLPDLLPRVILTKMVDGPDARRTPDDPARIIIPGIVDPLPFLHEVSSGVMLDLPRRLRVIVPPAAFRLEASGTRTPIGLPPPGRYRVNVLSPFGQTWSVPNDADLLFHRSGSAADPTQAEFVTLAQVPLPGGVITGDIQLGLMPPGGDYQVVVLAFAAAAPPPPLGTGRPVASAIVPKESFTGMSAPYQLAGLATGVYTVRAFLDANDNFTPWYDALSQPDRGDVGGGHLAGLSLADVNVDALGAPVTGVTVTIASPLAFTEDRPVFSLPSGATMHRGSPTPIRLDAVASTTNVLQAAGTFPVRWADLAGDGTADDLNGDGNPDVLPIVIAELLDPADASNLKLATPHTVLFSVVDPSQFAGLGFPAADPTQLMAVTNASSLVATFVPLPAPPPAGRYRVTVINARGQTWTVPSELQRATGDPLATSQAGVLTVVE